MPRANKFAPTSAPMQWPNGHPVFPPARQRKTAIARAVRGSPNRDCGIAAASQGAVSSRGNPAGFFPAGAVAKRATGG